MNIPRGYCARARVKVSVRARVRARVSARVRVTCDHALRPRRNHLDEGVSVGPRPVP